MNSKDCPQCGAPIKPGQRVCEYCKAELYITNWAYLSNYDLSGVQKYLKYYKQLVENCPQNSRGYLGLGLCYLQLEMYPLAKDIFKSVIDKFPEVAAGYYYYSLSLIAGKRLKFISFDTAEQIFSYLKTAIALDEKNMQYVLFLMMLQREFYIKNSLIEHHPTYEELATIKEDSGFDWDEVERLKNVTGITDLSTYT